MILYNNRWHYFILLKEISLSPFVSVYKAKDLETNKLVVIKKAQTDSESSIKRLENEARILEYLRDCPGVSKLVSSIHFNNDAYLQICYGANEFKRNELHVVIEWFDGDSLE